MNLSLRSFPCLICTGLNVVLQNIKGPTFPTRICQLWATTEESRDSSDLAALALGSEAAGAPVTVHDIMKFLLKPRPWGEDKSWDLDSSLQEWGAPAVQVGLSE